MEPEDIKTLSQMHNSKGKDVVVTLEVLVAYCPDDTRKVSYESMLTDDTIDGVACTLTVTDGSAFASVTLWNDTAGVCKRHTIVIGFFL